MSTWCVSDAIGNVSPVQTKLWLRTIRKGSGVKVRIGRYLFGTTLYGLCAPIWVVVMITVQWLGIGSGFRWFGINLYGQSVSGMRLFDGAYIELINQLSAGVFLAPIASLLLIFSSRKPEQHAAYHLLLSLLAFLFFTKLAAGGVTDARLYHIFGEWVVAVDAGIRTFPLFYFFCSCYSLLVARLRVQERPVSTGKPSS